MLISLSLFFFNLNLFLHFCPWLPLFVGDPIQFRPLQKISLWLDVQFSQRCFCSIVFGTRESVTVLMRKSEEINESVGLCQYPAVSLSSHYKYKYSAVVPAAFSSFPARQEEGAAEDEIIQLGNFLSSSCQFHPCKWRGIIIIFILYSFSNHPTGIIQYCTIYIHVDNWRRGSSRPDQVHQVIMISLEGMNAKIMMTIVNNDNNDQVQVHQVVTGMSWWPMLIFFKFTMFGWAEFFSTITNMYKNSNCEIIRFSFGLGKRSSEKSSLPCICTYDSQYVSLLFISYKRVTEGE